MAPTYTFRLDNEGDEIPIIGLNNYKAADAQRIGEGLEKIKAANNDKLKAEHVVDAARSPRHELHPYFEWKDKVAAEKHRLAQARLMIRAICVSEDERDPPHRAYYSITAKHGERSYHAHKEIIDDRVLTLALWRNAEADLDRWEQRYKVILAAVEHVRRARLLIREKLDDATNDDRPSN